MDRGYGSQGRKELDKTAQLTLSLFHFLEKRSSFSKIFFKLLNLEHFISSIFVKLSRCHFCLLEIKER